MRARLRRLWPAGLRWRLAAWVAVLMLATTAIAFVAVYRGTATELRKQIDQELSADAHELEATVTRNRSRGPRQIAEAAGAYVRDQPFSVSSTLLFVVVPGYGTVTNRPELFMHLPPDHGETLEEQASENQLAALLLTAPAGYSTLDLTDVGELRLRLLRLKALPDRMSVTAGVGETLATVAAAQRGVARAFILAGVLALAGALLAAYLIGSGVTRPLRRMAAVAARVDAGDLNPRIPETGREGDEVKVLADSFNHMLDRLTEAFASQRAFVADASHDLRTPLTVIRGQLEVLAAQPDPSGEEVRRVERLAQAEIARVSRLVDDLLLLAKSEHTEFLHAESIAVRPFVADLWDGMSLLADRRFELGPVPEGRLRADPDRLAQALRNLAVNAIDHTRPHDGLVRLRVQSVGPGRVRFIVEDDGPGIPPAERERVFHRFHRVDASRGRLAKGSGLGLAIVRAIADAHHGSVRAGVSLEGGARIELELPEFERTAAPSAPGAAGGDARTPAPPSEPVGSPRP